MAEESSSLLSSEYHQSNKKDSGVFKPLIMICVISLYSLSLEISRPLMAQYIYQRVSSQFGLLANRSSLNGSSSNKCHNAARNRSSLFDQEEDEAQDEASRWLLWLGIATGIPCSITCVFLGSLSDTLGRKLLFIIASVGTCCRGICFVVVVYWNLPLSYLFIGHIIEGFGGYYYSALLAAYAYSSDITTPSKSRTLLVMLAELGKYFASAIAELSTGLLIKLAGFIYPGFIIIGAMLLDICIVVKFMPETVPKMRKDSRISVYKHLKAVLDLVTKKDNVGNAARGFYILGVIAFLVYSLGISAESATDKLYFMDRPLCWNSEQIGYFEASRRISGPIGTLLAVWAFQRILPDQTIIHILGLSGIARQVTMAFATTSLIMYMSLVVGIVEVGFLAAVRSILSKETSPENQGALFAGLAMIEGITSTGGTAAFNVIYEVTLPYMKGAVFLYAGFMILVSMMNLWALNVRYLSRGQGTFITDQEYSVN